MGALRIYTNESVDVAVAQGLKRRGIDAWSVRDVGNLGLSDEAQFHYATKESAVIFTHDDDFLRLPHEWTQQEHEHWGIIFMFIRTNSALVSISVVLWTTHSFWKLKI